MSSDDDKQDDAKIVNLADAKKKLKDRQHKKQAPAAPPALSDASADDELLALAKANATYFKDDGEPYASVKMSGGHRDVLKLRSSDFRTWLDHLFWKAFATIPKAAKRKEVLAILEGLARFEGAEQRVHVRLASHDSATYLDLGNARRESVCITEEGWTIQTDAPVRFRRPKGMRSIPRPEQGGSIEELRPFVNLGDEGFRLLIAWLVGALRAIGPYPILVVQGEHGSGKSTTSKIAKRLLDDAKAPLRSMARSERDLAVATMNTWIPAFDNLSAPNRTAGLSPSISDALCRISTGGGTSARRLFTDDDEVIMEFIRPLIINGIDDLAVRPDLADRALLIAPETIKPEHRKDEKTFWADFERAAPRILGSLLDGVVSALATYPTVKLTTMPRMADFARWVTAAEPGLGWKSGTFIREYEHHRKQVDSDTIDRDAVARLVPHLPALRAGSEWSGTATGLLSILVMLSDASGARSSEWPAAPNALSAHLRRITPVLRANGYIVSIDRTAAERTITIRKVPSSSSSSSSSSTENAPHDEDDGHDDR